MGSDEIEPTDNESSDLEEIDHDDEQEISEIFRIETNLFNYEKPMCKEFKEFNYLLKIDPDLFTKDIKGFKTYEEFKDGWIYEWNKDDYEWYEALKDSELKEDALRNKAIMEGLIGDESHHEADEREELCEIHELPVCNMRKFKMIKYSFGQDKEYVAVKEDEYDGLIRTSIDARRAYQEIFRIMDEGWMTSIRRPWKQINIDEYWWRIYKSGDLEVLES
ncbi:hypothetical protein Tco_0500055 [Tanacetum coccineum]